MAELRKSLSPAPDDPEGVEVVCPGCGATYRRWKGRQRTDCPDCAAGRTIQTTFELRAKEGLAWERMVLGQLRYWTAEAERLGLQLGDRR
jgi:hypothetical protein